MGVRDALRRAKQRATQEVHGSRRVAGPGTRNVGSGTRRKPQNVPVSAHTDPEQGEAAPPSGVRTGIVSVNGRDVGKVQCAGGRRVS